jgi:CRISPR-associated endoribonuclease Cas6
VSNLIGGKRQRGMVQLHPKQTYRLRVTTLHSDLTSILKHGLTGLWWRNGIQLHDQQFHLVNVQTHGDWNIETLYYDLLSNASSNPYLKINFGAPTTFKQTGQEMLPFPISELVFQSLLTRWESYANVPLEMDIMSYVRHSVKIHAYKTQSQTARFIHGGHTEYVTGFTGEAVYHLGNNPQAIQILNALGEYSLFSGIGMKTTMGLGQCRMIPA